MAPTNAKANYKSYEAQARMVRAIVAAHPDVKWNYKDIAKYFGQSTGDGIQFQFRTIKKDADRLREAADNGGDVANCLDLGGGSSVMSTPSKSTPFSTPTSTRRRGGRGGARGASRGGGGSTRGKRKTTDTFIKRSSSDDEIPDEDYDDDEDVKDWSEFDESPSKRAKTAGIPGQKNGLPSRQAAVKAVATIADATASLHDSDSPSDAEPTPKTVQKAAAPVPQSITTTQTQPTQSIPTTIAPASIFAPVYAPPTDVPYTSMAEDAFFGQGYGSSHYGGPAYEHFGCDDDDGFI
jgi:hypothetical protein